MTICEMHYLHTLFNLIISEKKRNNHDLSSLTAPKRNISSNLSLIVGLSMPLDLPVAVAWVQNVQFQYNPIDNATEWTYLHLIQRSQGLSWSRTEFYQFLGKAWDRIGINGTSCVLRTICEISNNLSPNKSFMNKIIQTIFTPHRRTDKLYKRVGRMTHSSGDCDYFLSYCNLTISNILTGFI